jgi:hypothetical protein
MEEYRGLCSLCNWIGCPCYQSGRYPLLNEKEARRLAKIAVDGHAVELWQTDSFIERVRARALRPALLAGALHFECLLAPLRRDRLF